MTDTTEQDDALLYQVRVTLTHRLSDHVSLPPERCAEVSRALSDAIIPDICRALATAREGTDKLRRQVMGYRGMKDVYLRERNAAHKDLIEAERIIELLCDDREAGQAVAKAALTEQRERAEKAERERDEYRERFTNQMTAGSELVEKLRQAEAAVRQVREMAEAAKRESVASFARRVTGEPFPARLLADDILAALDAEGRPDEAPTCSCDGDPVECSHEAARGQAEATVQRSREALTRLAFGPVPTSREVLNAWRASLATEQPEGT